ncbi:hypothetical protein IQ219_00610 [Synechocystis sp. LEGE 06083]|uniref:hypothetical protein n=1 Tax=Synechocystis sp. LEGE 06083 TaxID=915336 RepID=UPI001882CB13|nr:hypothetical protein [Synechocystis sp. LEGE 06083]MBE9193858.1 hypothetical protein [Synechocystis sp. LEGE 06083]
MRIQFIALALLCSAHLPAFPQSDAFQSPDHVGDSYEIRLESESHSTGDNGSGSSSSRSTLIERVLQVQADGVELEFDLPSDTPPEQRMREWQFPARVFKSSEGTLDLLNVTELESRLDIWLERGGVDRVHCGKWLFTWTALQINCDPYSVLETLKMYDLRLGEIHPGRVLNDALAKAPAPLKIEVGSEANTYVADFELDPDLLRRRLAETDVAVSEIMGPRPLSLAEAIEARSSETISGALRMSLEIDPEGRVIRRTRLSNTEIKQMDGSVHRTTVTETVYRQANVEQSSE